jgi:hypothetical protein
LTTARTDCPDLSKLIVSKENVEKVVNEPNSPTIIKSRRFGDNILTKDSWKTKPITKQPIIFAKNVPKGNPGFMNLYG